MIFSGGGFTKSVLPSPGQAMDVQDEFFKELTKRDWSGERAIEEIRKNRIMDRDGRKYLNTAAMTQEA